MRNRFLVIFAVVTLAFAAPAQAQLPPVNGLRWRSVGPNRGGRSLAVAGSRQRPLEYYFGATGGGLWKTTDGGTTWRPVTDGQITSSSVGAIAVAESNPDIVYIGTGESELRGNTIQGDGVYKTTDGGKTWTHVGLENTQVIARLRVDPTNPDVVYAAALGHPYGANEERGVYRSRDGGRTWQRVLFRNDHVGAIDLSLDPHHPQVLFASLWEVYRRPWTLWSGGEGSGVFKSTDGGDHWTEITRNPGLPKTLLGKINVSVSGADGNRVYANIETEPDGGLYRSDDGGATWMRVNEDRNIRQRAFYFNRIQADPNERDTVYAMNVEFWRSTDGGRTLTRLATPHSDHHDLWIAPDNSTRMIAADDGGASVSVNRGQTWTRENYPTGQFYHVATTKDVPYHICGAQQDEGTACVSSEAARKHYTPSNPDMYYSPGGGEAAYVAPDPLNLGVFYAGDQAGILDRFDRNTGQMRNVQVNPLMFSGMPAKDLPERWQWVFPIVFSPLDPHVLYTSSQHLFRTTNEGQSWERISPDLTRADPATLGDSGGPIMKDQNGPEIYATIYTIAPSHLEANTIWVGSDDGLVHITRDGGRSWQDVTPPALPQFTRVSLIEASWHRAGTAFLAANRYELDDRRPYVFRTDDYGKTWRKITAGIPENDFARALREDPKRADLLYLGTEHGVYVSFDGGGNWQSLALNLPDTQVPDLVVEDDDLVIATHGRSFYVLDGISALRQFTPAVAGEKVHLFAPATAIRPLRPARIDYFLAAPVQTLTLTILDAAGKTVASFSSAEGERAAPAVAAGTEEAPGIPAAVPARTPERKPGLNRFVWDMRYPGATVFPGMVLRGGNPSAGPLAVPGQYQVQLTADGVTQTQPLTIIKDPRLTRVSQADLEQQFALASQVRDATSHANQMVIRIRELKQQIADRVAKVPQLAGAGRAFAARLSQVEEAIYQVRNRSPRDTLNYPIKLNNQLAVLMGYVEMGESKPTEQMYTVFRDLSARLAELRAQLESTIQSDLAAFNQQLRNAGAEPVGGE